MHSVEGTIMKNWNNLLLAREEVTRWTAERNYAEARMELAQRKERAAHLLSQYEPVASLGLDREKLSLALEFLVHGDEQRIIRSVSEIPDEN